MDIKISRRRAIALRIATGFGMLGAAISLLWPPSTWDDISKNFEPILALCISIVAWLAVEIWPEKQSHNEGGVQAKVSSHNNDIRKGRKFAALYRNQYRLILKDHDWSSRISSELVSEVTNMAYILSNKEIFFFNQQAQNALEKFSMKLAEFANFIAHEGGSEPWGSSERFSIYTKRQYSDGPLPARVRENIRNANVGATELWFLFESLIDTIKIEIPEIYDEKISHFSTNS